MHVDQPSLSTNEKMSKKFEAEILISLSLPLFSIGGNLPFFEMIIVNPHSSLTGLEFHQKCAFSCLISTQCDYQTVKLEYDLGWK